MWWPLECLEVQVIYQTSHLWWPTFHWTETDKCRDNLIELCSCSSYWLTVWLTNLLTILHSIIFFETLHTCKCIFCDLKEINNTVFSVFSTNTRLRDVKLFAITWFGENERKLKYYNSVYDSFNNQIMRLCAQIGSQNVSLYLCYRWEPLSD